MKDGKFSVGIIGVGKRGVYFGNPNLCAAGGYYVSCVCDLKEEMVDRAIEELGDDVTGYTDIDAFLAHPDLDAVVVVTDDKSHAEVTMKVHAAKKHVFLEKPMAQTIEDCDMLVDAWTGETVFMVGLELRYCTLMQQCKEIMNRGDIGKVIVANVVDNVSVGGNYFFHNHWRKESFVKSLVLQKGTHSLDLANWIIDDSPVKVYASSGLDVFGGDGEDIRCVDCDKAETCPYFRNREFYVTDYGKESQKRLDGDRCVYSGECEVHDNAIVLVNYEHGARMSYIECHFTPEYTREFTFIGDKGKMTAFYNNEQEFKIMVWKRHEEKPVYYYPQKVTGNGAAAHAGGDIGIIKEFGRRIREGKPCMVGIKGARDSAAIAIAAYESEKNGMPVNIPKGHAFEGDER